jgi:hypothetical protein
MLSTEKITFTWKRNCAPVECSRLETFTSGRSKLRLERCTQLLLQTFFVLVRSRGGNKKLLDQTSLSESEV